MEAQGFLAIWGTFATPQFLRGIGHGSQKASKVVHLIGAFHDGKLLGYSALVLDENPVNPSGEFTPFLFSLDQISALNGLFDSRRGQIHCLPEGTSVTLLAGTRTLQCDKSPSGHWLLGVSHWGSVTPAERQNVQGI